MSTNPPEAASTKPAIPPLKCDWCNIQYSHYLRHCPDCDLPNTVFPNVHEVEQCKAALRATYQNRRSEALKKGLEDVWKRFEERCQQSHAVLNRHPSQIIPLISDQKTLYANWYQLKNSGVKLLEDKVWDRRRKVADDYFFHEYEDRIYFASLSLDECGLWNYGACTLVLKDKLIQLRTTLFAENTVTWCMKRNLTYEEITEDRPPEDQRALWSERHLLCCIKCHDQLHQEMDDEAFPSVLLRPGTNTADDVFIEVHIHGTFSRNAVSKVVIQESKIHEAELMCLRECLQRARIPLEVVS